MPKFESKPIYSRLLILCFLGGILFWYSPALAYDSRDVVLEKPKKEINLSQLDKEISGALGLKKNLGLSMNSNEDGGGQIIIHFSNQSITPTEEQLTIIREAIERHIAKPMPPRADIAEYYASSPFESLEAGDIVALDLTATSSALVKADRLKHPYIIGVISENPALALAREDGGVPLALVGRVSVRVSSENGAVVVGDRITASSLPGVGMKAGPYDPSIGIALESLNGDFNKILIFVRLDRGFSELAAKQGTIDLATLNSDLNMNNFSLLNVKSISGMNGLWKIDEGGNLVVQDIKTQTISSTKGLTTYDEDSGQPYCIKIKGGQIVTAVGYCQDANTSDLVGSPTSEPAEVGLPLANTTLGVILIATSTPEIATSTEPMIATTTEPVIIPETSTTTTATSTP